MLCKISRILFMLICSAALLSILPARSEAASGLFGRSVFNRSGSSEYMRHHQRYYYSTPYYRYLPRLFHPYYYPPAQHMQRMPSRFAPMTPPLSITPVQYTPYTQPRRR
jgi:hypothetical protein